MSHLVPLVPPSSIVIWIFTILLLPQLSLQEEGHLHPTELSLSTESPESATWAAAEYEEGEAGREVETRSGSEGISIIDLLTMTTIFDENVKTDDNGSEKCCVFVLQSSNSDTLILF